jgi:hypothetical protein
MTLNEYFKDPGKFKKRIIVISVKDEGSKYVKNFSAAAGLKLKMKFAFQNSYVAVVDPKRDFLYEKSSTAKIECSYKVGDKYIDIVSAGFGSGKRSSVRVSGEEYSLDRTGLNVVIFNARNLKLVDSFSCDSYRDENLTVTK